jgi:hypothetical protein
LGATRALVRDRTFRAWAASGLDGFATGLAEGCSALRAILPTEASSARATTWRAAFGDWSWFLRITVIALFPAGK